LSITNSSFRELLQWQNHLEKTYASLDASRNQKKGKPFFVLEHGLDEIDLAEVCNLIIDHGNYDLSFEGIELPFIVFATEIGFNYENARHKNVDDTSNYWPMFDLKIPGWRTGKNTSFFRYVFSEYLTDRYKNIYLPDGYWFEKFPNISWPVYQAILCKDARQDLIRLMRRINNEYDLGSITSPLQLGELLGTEITRLIEQNESLRLDQFQDQHRLLGEIAYSIVKPENDLQVDFLSSYALGRIKESLPKELLEVVDSIRANISRTVSHRQSSRSNSANTRNSYQGGSANRLSGEVKIEGDKSSGQWKINLHIPKLRIFESVASNLREVLHEYLHVKDQSEGRIPPKTLLYRDASVPLDHWPVDPHLAMFESENFPSSVTQAIRGDWKMFSSEDLLFKIDNLHAKLQRHFEIQLDQKYLYIRKDPIHYVVPSIFESVSTSLGDQYYSYEFCITEKNFDDALYCIQSADLVYRPTISIFPVGEVPYIYEKDVSCKYSVNQRPVFKIESAGNTLTVSLSEEGSEEFQSIQVKRSELIELQPSAPGSYWIRVETVLGDEGFGTLWKTEIIASLRVDFLTPNELAEISGQQILMMSSVANPSIEQIIAHEVEVSFNGLAGLQAQITMEAIDSEGESYPVNDLGKIKIPISSEYVESQFNHLAQKIGEQSFDDVSSIWWHMSVDGIPLYSREFFSSRKKIRWQRSKQKDNFAKLIAKGIEPNSFKVFGASFSQPTELKAYDSENVVRNGLIYEDLMMLLPTEQVDQWPPSLLLDHNEDEESNSRTLDKAMLTIFKNTELVESNLRGFEHFGLTREDFSNSLLMLQLLYSENKGKQSHFTDFMNGHFLDRLSAEISIEMIGPRWIDIEQSLQMARSSSDNKKLSKLIDSLPDLLDELQKSSPEDFGWINPKGLWTGREQSKVAQLTSAQRAVMLSNKCLLPDPFLSPLPEEFRRFSEKQYRAFDLGLMFTINPLAAGERMIEKPISAAGWDSFWNHRAGISLYCRLNHIQNLELGVEWTWN
jgi:hypothetical protein